MTSIYQRVLGSDFGRLHPQIQRRFGFASTDDLASIGRGLMEEVWKGRFYTVPFLYVGTWRRIMFPETGRNIPFTIENYAFVDRFGRETVSWIRTFESRRTRRFDAYMIYSEARGRVVDYLGSHEHLAVDIDLSVDQQGGVRLRSGAQRFYEGPVGFNFPMLLVVLRTCASGTTRRRSAFALPSTYATRLGGRCSAIVEASTWSGGRSELEKYPSTSCRAARSVESKRDR